MHAHNFKIRFRMIVNNWHKFSHIPYYFFELKSTEKVNFQDKYK